MVTVSRPMRWRWGVSTCRPIQEILTAEEARGWSLARCNRPGPAAELRAEARAEPRGVSPMARPPMENWVSAIMAG